MIKHMPKALLGVLLSLAANAAEPIVTIPVPTEWQMLSTDHLPSQVRWIVLDPDSNLNLNCTIEQTENTLAEYLEQVRDYQCNPPYCDWRILGQIVTDHGPFSVSASHTVDGGNLHLLQVIGKVRDYAVIFSAAMPQDHLSAAMNAILPMTKAMKFWDSESQLVDNETLARWNESNNLAFEPLPERLADRLSLNEWLLAQFQIMRHIAEKRSNDFNQAEGSLVVQQPQDEALFSDAMCGDDL